MKLLNTLINSPVGIVLAIAFVTSMYLLADYVAFAKVAL